jgi:Protein of unknown function (DUF4232)
VDAHANLQVSRIGLPDNPRVPGSRLVAFAAAAASFAVSILPGSPARAVPIATGDEGTPCWGEQVAVNASPTDSAVGHRGVVLIFSLVGGEPCTLTGYPSVDSGTGGPTIHADNTPRGYMGGLPATVDDPPSVILSVSTQAQAIVEGMVVDSSGNPCPRYTNLRVSPPAINFVFTVPATVEACQLQVHPVTPG